MPTFLRPTILLLLTTATLCSAQIPVARRPPCAEVAANLAYDVVSIHPSKPNENPHQETRSMGAGGDRFRATNIQLAQLLQFAYDLPEDQISGLTGPAASTPFDIEAKVLAPDPATPVHLKDRQLQCMVVPLLADRFHLVTHTETRTRSLYELVAVKGGPRLERAADSDHDGSLNTTTTNTAWKLTARAVTMTDFATSLAQARRRPILNKTGLEGRYTFTLTWISEDAEDTDQSAAPGLLTALQEQLGLKLQPAKGPVDVLVVDHVEMPTEN